MLVGRGDKDGKKLHVLIAQDEVRAAADEDALFVPGDAADLMALQGKEHFARRFAAQHMVVALMHRLEQVRIRGLFVGGRERLFRKLAILAGEADELPFIHADAKQVGGLDCNLVAAAAELTADADDAIFHTSFLRSLFISAH